MLLGAEAALLVTQDPAVMHGYFDTVPSVSKKPGRAYAPVLSGNLDKNKNNDWDNLSKKPYQEPSSSV